MKASEHELTGLVFNIQKFSIQDGPGIRTTVFMKGCPLLCPWCSNPEGMGSAPEIMPSERKCIACKQCLEACAPGAISFRDDIREIDWACCSECLACAGTRRVAAATGRPEPRGAGPRPDSAARVRTRDAALRPCRGGSAR